MISLANQAWKATGITGASAIGCNYAAKEDSPEYQSDLVWRHAGQIASKLASYMVRGTSATAGFVRECRKRACARSSTATFTTDD